MDSDIDQLKELVRQNIALTQDTNRIVHKLRRSSWWGRFFQIIWWLLIIAASGVAYYYYQPYLLKIEQLYGQIQQSGQQAQNYEGQISSFFANFVQKQGTSTTQ